MANRTILNIAQSTSRYNLHTHTQFCDGRDVMEHFVQSAIALGFTHLGFTPHGPLLDVESPCNMARERVPEYLDEVERLRRAYGHRITILAGMEVDYIDGSELTDPGLCALPLNYRIGSVHFLPSITQPGQMVDVDGRFERFSLKMHDHFGDDIEAVVRSFFARSMAMLDTGGFDVVGHFDKIGLNASLFRPGIDHEPWYDGLVGELLESIMDHGYIVEVNTKAWQEHGRFFPNQTFFAMLKQYHTPIIISSDAHYPDRLDSGRDQARRLLDEA